MHKTYKDYIWKNGKPYGSHLTSNLEGITYRIPVDPYYKRFSLEQYEEGRFKALIYDSYLFDFRNLKKPEHAQWRKEALSENEMLFRDEVDRAILKEVYRFENDLPRETEIYTLNGFKVATQKILYEALGDEFNGVKLLDTLGKTVMEKRYAVDVETKEFTTLLLEAWEFKPIGALL